VVEVSQRLLLRLTPACHRGPTKTNGKQKKKHEQSHRQRFETEASRQGRRRRKKRKTNARKGTRRERVRVWRPNMLGNAEYPRHGFGRGPPRR